MAQETPTTPSADDHAQDGVLTAKTGADATIAPEETPTDDSVTTDQGGGDLADDGGRISPKHRKYLINEGVSEGYLDRDDTLIRTSRVLSDLPDGLGWVPDPRGLLFGWRGLDGVTTWQFRPDTPPLDDDGREMKYLFPRGSAVKGGVLIRGEVEQVPEGALFAPAPRPLLIVEGTKQGHAAASAILTSGANGRRRHTLDRADVLAIPGCWGWSAGKTAPQELRDFARGRRVFVALDADAATNRRVYDAGTTLARELGEAELVRFIHVPGAGKSGLDDWIKSVPVAERLGALEDLADSASPRPAQKRPHPKSSLLGQAQLDGVEFDPFTEDGQFRPTSTARFLIKQRHYATVPGGELATYHEGRYVVREKQLVSDLVDLMGDLYTTGHLGNVESILRALCEQQGRKTSLRMSEPLVNCRNGLLDLRTGELLPHDPKYLLMRQIAVDWNPDADTTAWDEWCLDRIGPQQQAVLEEGLSQLLDASRAPTKAVFVFGPPRSGKSTVARVAEALCGGTEYVSAVPLEKLGDTFSAANLYGKAVNLAMDLPSGHIPDLSVFKTLTGEDVVFANQKYGDTFSFRNMATFVFSANNLPTVGETSGAYEARIVPVWFPRTYLGNENPEIERHLLENIEGVFLRLVQAWQRRYEKGMGGASWTKPPQMVSDKFREDSDRVARFVASACEVDYRAPADNRLVSAGGAVVGPATKSQVYEHFKAWVETENGKPMGRKAFLERLLTMPGIDQMQHPITRTRVLSIGLLPQDAWQDVADQTLAEALFTPSGGEPAGSGEKVAHQETPGQSTFSGSGVQNVQVLPETSRGVSVPDSAAQKEASPGSFPTEPAHSARSGTETPSHLGKRGVQLLSGPRQPLPEPFHLLSTETLALLDARGHHATQWGGSPEQVREMGRDQGPCFTLDELLATAAEPDMHPNRLRAAVQFMLPAFADRGVVIAERRLALPEDGEWGVTEYVGQYDAQRRTPQNLDAAHTAYIAWLMPGWKLLLHSTPSTSTES